MLTVRPLPVQLEKFREFLSQEKLDRSSPVFKQALDWVRRYPGDIDEETKDALRLMICDSFSLTQEELQQELVNVKPKGKDTKGAEVLERELLHLIPRGGFLARYCEYTKHSEAPLAYHLFSALTAVGAVISRRLWFDMGYYHLYPNISVVLVGPSGLKKTSAANIAISILQDVKLCKIYSEKLTPEQLVESMTSDAKGLIYAPEMAVFLGKQRYNEGLVPLITRFLDCPDHWSSETIMRGKRELSDIALSSLMCTTPDWFISNTPADTFGGGFVARNLLIVQEDSPRIEPIPNPGSVMIRTELVTELSRIHHVEGRVTMLPNCDERYREWYAQAKELYKNPEHELLATYYQRKPDHVKRLAMNIHACQHMTNELDVDCFNRALAILDWTEKFLPAVLRKMFKSAIGAEQEMVYKVIVNAGGVIEHSLLVRKVAYRINAQQLRNVVNSLKEAGMINEKSDRIQHIYFIKETMNEG